VFQFHLSTKLGHDFDLQDTVSTTSKTVWYRCHRYEQKVVNV
jgi:hypothetical protein